ncbi:MAG: hypothetical protein ABJF01_22940 [bacterium]
MYPTRLAMLSDQQVGVPNRALDGGILHPAVIDLDGLATQARDRAR